MAITQQATRKTVNNILLLHNLLIIPLSHSYYLNPYCITGFVYAEGCFTSIYKDSRGVDYSKTLLQEHSSFFEKKTMLPRDQFLPPPSGTSPGGGDLFPRDQFLGPQELVFYNVI